MGASRVTIVIPTYNRAQYLREAVTSCLAQSFGDFELIVIDDGSTDGSAELVRRFADRRIRLIRNEQNRGVAAVRNQGLEEAKGELVALLDSDDIALPERLERQVSFMDSHPEVGICGSAAEFFGDCETRTVRFPVEPARVKVELLFRDVLTQSSVIMRRQRLLEHRLFYESHAPAEDYDLWVRASRYMDVANLAEVLIRYRVHRSQLSQADRIRLVPEAQGVRARQLVELGIAPTPEESVLHEALATVRLEASPKKLMATHRWLVKLRKANHTNRVFPEPIFSEFLGEMWWSVFRHAERPDRVLAKRFLFSPLLWHTPLSWRDRLSVLRQFIFGPPRRSS